MMKRIAKLLIFMMMIQLMPQVYVSANTGNDENSAAVKFLTVMGIIKFDSATGEFWGETPVRRVEMAEILSRLFAAGDDKANGPMFSDVSEQDRTAVESVVKNGYMQGNGDGTFEPDGYITNEQLVKIIVSLLGGDGPASAIGGYPSGYMAVGKKLGILGGIRGGMTDSATRSAVAETIYKALHTDMIYVESMSASGAEYSTIEGETLLTECLDTYRYEGIVEKTDGSALGGETAAQEGCVQVDGKVYKDELDLLDNMLGSSVVIYVKQSDELTPGTVIYVTEDSNNTRLKINSTELLPNGTSNYEVRYYSGDKAKKLTVSPSADVIYNGDEKEWNPELINGSFAESGYIEFTDNNGDGKYDVVYIVDYTIGVVRTVSSVYEKIVFDFNGGEINLKDRSYIIERNGERASISDVKEGDVALVAKPLDTSEEPFYRIIVSSDAVTGAVSVLGTRNDTTYVTIGGLEYRVTAYCERLVKNGAISSFSAGDSGTFYLTGEGDIAWLEIKSSTGGVGYLIAAALDDNPFTPNVKVKMFTENGNIEVMETGDKVKVDGMNMKASELTGNNTLMDKFMTPQLVKYASADNVLKEIEFAVSGYDEEYFSLDVDASTTATKIPLTSTGVLDNKYYVTAGTKVFAVSGTPGDDDPAHYTINTGTYFAKLGEKYATRLYDVEKNGFVRYAVRTRWWGLSGCWAGSPLVFVDSVADSINADGNGTKTIIGWNEKGNGVVLEFNDPDAVSEVEKGDVIQYANDFSAKPHGVDILQKASNAVYAPKNLGYAKYAYGYVVRRTPDSMQICAKGYDSNVPPTAVDLFVMNSDCPVYVYDKERNKCLQQEYSEISPGDLSFAYVDENNKTRMIVIYK